MDNTWPRDINEFINNLTLRTITSYPLLSMISSWSAIAIFIGENSVIDVKIV